MVWQNDILGGSSGQGGGYVIPYSMWGPDAPSSGPKLERTLTEDGNANPKFTFATWYKRGRPTTSAKAIFQFWCPNIHATQGQWTIDFTNDVGTEWYGAGMRMNLWNGSVSASDWNTNSLASSTGHGMMFRDYGAWMHLCHVTDYSTSPYVFVYINGVLMNPDKIYGNKAGPGYATNFSPTNGARMNIACTSDGNGPGNGGFADTYFIEGQALNPIGTFLEIDEDTNQVRAIEYTGTYAGNSFYMDYADADDFGKDQSGLGNDFTESGIAAKYQLIDSPQSNTGSNFANWNPLWGRAAQMPKLKRGNRSAQAPAAAQSPCTATFGQLVSGKWYWEISVDSKGGSDCFIGVLNTSGMMTDVAQGNHYYRFYLADTGNKNTDTNASTISYGNTYTGMDIISVALDMDNGAIYFAKNGTWQDSGDPTSGSSKTGAAFDDVLSAIPAGGRNGGDGWVPAVLCMDTTVDYICNFGQDGTFDTTQNSGAGASDGKGYGDFYYTPPAGYLGLCSDNLPVPSIKLPEEHYKTINYTGNGSTQTISTVGFKSDSTWIHDRSQGNNWVIQPSTNANNFFISNGTSGEQSNTNYITSFTSDGFTIGNSSNVNYNNDWFYAANWLGGGAAVTNTDGSRDSEVSANPTAGFSIVEFEGTGSAFTVGHGLSQTPEWIIGKSQAASTNWPVMTDNSNPSSVMYLNLNNTPGSDSGSYTSVSASTIGIGTTTDLNQGSTGTQLWCFHSVPGYSKMGKCKLIGSSPSGNDGTFIYLGFKPQFFMWKMTGTTHDWVIYDRDLMPGYGVTAPKNVGNVYLVPPRNYADQLSQSPMIGWDYLCNGIKQRQDYSAHVMVYMAFAARPFNYSKAG